MTDYIGDSLNGVVKTPSLLAPDSSYGIFFLKDGTMKIVADPESAAQVEALAFGTAGSVLLSGQPTVQNIRTRFTIAQVNAGATLLAAKAGVKYRMVHCTAIAVGGAATAVTTVDVLGTVSTPRKLVAYAQASLTQSTVLSDGHTGAAVLADGASYTANDANTAITVGVTGSPIATATHIDINFDYVIEV